MTIRNPDGKTISFTVVNFEERNRLVKTEAVNLYKVDKNFIFRSEIYQLNNGDYLFLYTVDAYAFRFTSQEELDLFTNNKDHFTCSLHIDTKANTFHYQFDLHNDKSIEKMKHVVAEIPGYPNRSPMLHFKLSASFVEK